MKNLKLFQFVILALVIKLILVSFTTFAIPEGKFLTDSHDYISLAKNLFATGEFVRDVPDGTLSREFFRTPGYPVFLGILHIWLKIPFGGIVFIQSLLTIGIAFFTFKTAHIIDHKLAVFSGLVILFDPAINLFSLQILTETLFVFLLSIYMYCIVRYLKEQNIILILYAALTLGAATYVRPVGFFLPFVTAIYLSYTILRKFISSSPEKWQFLHKTLTHILVILFVAHACLVFWQQRNQSHFGRFSFSNVRDATIKSEGLYKSYSRPNNPHRQNMGPVTYYVKTTTRCMLSLMTRPSTFKHFDKTLGKVWKVFAYPWIIFWLIGFLAGITRMKENIYFNFLVFVILYFIVASIGGAMLGVNVRFRVPMMPFIAILSAFGWQQLQALLKK